MLTLREVPRLDERLEAPKRARVVVIGGGVVGASILYHLTMLGACDVVVLEQDELTSGSTWHGAGLCTQFSANRDIMAVLRYSVQFYRELEQQTDGGIGFHSCGSLRLASTSSHMDEFARVQGIAQVAGVPFEIVPPTKVADLFPLASSAGILGAAYLPTDGHAAPPSLTTQLALRASAPAAAHL